MKYLIAFLLILVLCASAQAQTANTTLTNIANNTAINLGALTCTLTSPGGGCVDWVNYSRIIYDRVAGRMLGWGGGHDTAFSDSVFSLSLNAGSSLLWTELYPPTQQANMTVGNWDSTLGAWKAGTQAGGPYPRPTSTHSVGALTHDPIGNQLITIAIKDIGPAGHAPTSYAAGKYAHYSLAANTWSFSTAGASFNSPPDEATPCAYDPLSKQIICILSNQASIITYNPVTQAKTTRLDGGVVQIVKNEAGVYIGNDQVGYNNTMIYNPHDQNFYLLLTGSPVKVFRITLDRNNYANSTITLLTATSAPSLTVSGFAYDSTNQVFGTVSNNTFYYFNWRTKAWATQAVIGAPGSLANSSFAMDYDPVNNVFIFVNQAFQTWAYRFITNAASTDFATRCAHAGVIRCEGFDDTGWMGTGVSHGTKTTDEASSIISDTTIKSSGAASAKINIPLNCDPNTGDRSGFCVGNWEIYYNFAEDLSVQQKANTTTYVSMRIYMGPNFVPTQAEIEQGHGGFKLFAIGEGDTPGVSKNSCVDLTQSAQNGAQLGFGGLTTTYNVCQGGEPGQGHQEYIPVGFGGIPDYKLQNGRASPFCTYNQAGAAPGSEFPPTGNCWDNRVNQWVTYKYVIQTGSIDTSGGTVPCGSSFCLKSDFWLNSRSQLWAARDGQNWQLLIDWQYEHTLVLANTFSRPLYRGATAENLGYGKVWMGPRNLSHWTASTFMNYDELIVSSQDIAAPGVAAVVIPDTTIPTVAITSPVPPTASTTVSPITVSGTATDNIGVTSVTWTCIACVTKGGTATGPNGSTSVSWLIPALDFVGAGSYTLNVISHDAAGNVSTTATLIIAYSPTTTYWVNSASSGSHCVNSSTDPGVGSSSQTITQGLACIGAAGTQHGGEKVFVKAGTYVESLVDVIPSGSPGSMFTLQCVTDLACLINPSGNNSQRAIEVGSTGMQWVTIRGFKSTTGLGFRWSGSLLTTAHDVWLLNNEIDGTSAGTDNFGITMGGASNFIIRGNNVHHLNGCAGLCHGIYLTDLTNNFQIDGNTVHDNGAYGLQFFANDQSTMTNHIVKNNILYRNGLLHSSSGSGMVLYGTNYTVYNNVSYNNDLGGILIRQGTGAVYGNTVYGNTEGGIYNDSDGNQSVTCANNLSIGNGSGNVRNCTASTNITTGTTASHFGNAAAGNFTLVAGSTAIGAGANLGSPYNVDITNTLRVVPWDVGAYKFSGVVPIITIVNPTANPTLSVTSPLFSLGGTSNLP